MAITFDDIKSLDNGAQFVNADLHVHSFGASHDIKDPTMTPQALIDAAVAQGLSVLAITDHNTDANLTIALEYAVKYTGSLLVLPGVEITTAHGHLLAYFSPANVDKVRDLLGRIHLVGKRGEQDTHTTMSMADVIREVETLGGVSIAAHIDLVKTGFEMMVAGYPNWKKDILLSPGLYGLEMADDANLRWYSLEDDGSPQGIERRKLYETRKDNPGTAARAKLARVQGSDAHSLKAFNERNAARTLTRIKMDDGSFESFRTALVDPDARVRAAVTLPKSVPRVRGIHVAGGFLDGQIFHFSDNLNCFIGGRGTGKSSALKTLAHGLGISEELEEQDNCPDTVVVYCEDAAGVLYRYERRRGLQPTVKAREDGGIVDVPPDAFRVEFYGQGHLAEVAKDPLKHPLLLQKFLDRHIILRDLQERERELVEMLEENSGQLIPLENRFGQLPALKKSAKELDVKLRVAEEGKLKEIAATQVRLSNEKGLLQSLEDVKKFYRNGMSFSGFLRDYEKLSEAAGQLTGSAKSVQILAEASKLIGAANAFLTSQENQTNAGLKKTSGELGAKITELRQNQAELETSLADKIAALRKKGLSGSLADLNALVAQRTTLTRSMSAIDAQRPQLEALRATRAEYLSELDTVRNEIIERRKKQLQDINKHLGKTLQDYFVFIRYEAAGVIDEFKELILDAMQGSHFSEQLAERFCAATTPATLAKHLMENDGAAIAKIVNMGDWAAEIVSRLRTLDTIHKLEHLRKPPCPIIGVRTKGTAPQDIPVNQLSDGQKHTILLTIAMFAESNLPLIIDQPEDDLDNAFIFGSVVAVLREIKERRQVILVTHNANIAVLGDAELLVPMKRTADKGVAFEAGSIDRAETKMVVRDILEGGDLAFRRRMEIYGY